MSSLVSCIFSLALIWSFIWAIFFVSACLLCSKGRSLRCSPEQDNPHGCVVALYVGRGLRGNSVTCSALGQLSLTSTTTHKKTGPFWCWFPGGLGYIWSRTLWVSPMNSPERLRVALTTVAPTGFFRGFEALFLCTGTLGCAVCLTPQFFLPVYPHSNVGPPGLPATTSASTLATTLPIQVL